MMAREKSVPLSRERIVATAVGLADAGGFQSLSMRNIAEELGAGTMALYRHVANKEDLLDDMVDVVFAEMYPPAIGGRWKRELRERGISARAALQRHPWAVGLMETRMQPGPGERRPPQRDDGLPARSWVRRSGRRCTPTTCSTPTPTGSPCRSRRSRSRRRRSRATWRRPPWASEATSTRTSPRSWSSSAKRGYDYTEEFEFGLDFILDGLERYRRAIGAGARSR